MCQDHLCRLGFCLSCWQRDLCMEELNNSELLMPGWVSSILIIHWHLSLLQTKANQPVRVLKATWAISIHRWVPVISAIDAAQCPRAPFFPQHNLEPPVISLLWCYALPPTEISCSSQQVGTQAERWDRQFAEEAVRAGTVLWLLPVTTPLCSMGQQHCPTAEWCEYWALKLCDATGTGLHEDQRQAHVCNLSFASTYIHKLLIW